MRKNLVTPAATAAATAVSAGTALARRVAGRRQHGAGMPPARDVDAARWRSVTVLRNADEIRDAKPAALAELGPAIEIALRAAPGDRGTVISARLTEPQLVAQIVDKDPARAVRQLRQALRHAKSELEVGWVVTPSRSDITPTPLNRPLREAEERAQGEGRS